MPDRVLYRSFSSYLRERFGGPMRKISLHAGFTCPNRDGTLSAAGCCFCAPMSFAPSAAGARKPLEQQLREGIAQGKAHGIQRFMAYFQAFTNTYAPVPDLQRAYDAVRAFPEVKALAIGTRPDCVNEEILDLIATYAKDYEVWIEYGLQSIHDETLQRINRGHDAQAFFRAVTLSRRYPEIKLCAHVILGLPGETPAQELETARTLARLRLEGVKLHPLHVVKETALAEAYQRGEYIPLTQQDYVERAVDFITQLWPQTVIQRLTADCPANWLLAPDWLKEKSATQQAMVRQFKQRGVVQGSAWMDPTA